MLRALLALLRNEPSPALASVFQRGTTILVQASDRTRMRIAGFWVAAGPVASVASTDAPEVVGAAVLDALARSRVEVPVPPRDADLEAPLRRAAGVRSRRALMAGTRACVIERDGAGLLVTPFHNGGTSGDGRGYRPLPDGQAQRLAALATAAEVGRAVLAALARATVAPPAP